MAEGIEEAESNNSGGETTVMLGAVMPCEMTSSSMGGIKRELETAATATSPATTPIIQQQPINLKSEDFDRDHESPSNSPARPLSRNSNYGIFGNQILSPERNLSQEHAKNAAAVAAAQAHFSGTMQGMLNLQKLQNLASMQHSTMPSLQSLQDLTGLTSVPSLNSPSPLNLSVGAGQTLPSCTSVGGNLGGIQMPQLILASGQLMQGIQGAQLLIPTSQGITTQTILTIPVSQQISSSEHLAQSLANLNGNSNLGKMNIPQNHIMHPSQSGLGNNNILSPHHLSTSVQQLLTAIQPQLFSQSSNQSQNIHQQQQQQQQQQHQQQQQQQQQQQHQQSSILTSQQISPVIHTRVQTPKASPPRSLSSTHERHHPYEKLMITTSTTISQSQPQQTLVYTHPSNGHSQISTSPHLLGSRVHSPTSLALNNINRLAATNGEITITKSHGPSPSLGSSSSSSSHIGGPQLVPQIKLSPSSMHLSPTESDASGADLLDDSPNEPTINQTNCNVVDGIDLDEIKEFAKAFKLRRLSLGLTQTQVGQALSVTEGPAYSQSAICSALAAQMYAAQLSSQQQAMFEKLDITPKSAQKIKPVLERWMKEAEERYKSGQNHLTDFIGVEPSKKRKRRTSFTPQALELLNAHFERNTHPSGTEITGLAHQLGYEREVIRIWFCNKRQALKNTVRMMSKGLV